MILILDLDGSIADNTHRLHLLPTGNGATTQQWAAFNNACGGDSVIESTRDFFFKIQETAKKVLVVTGRAECSRKPTERWLMNHGIVYDQLIMRPDDDHRKSVEFKREVFEYFELSIGDVVIEDDPSVISMLKEEFPLATIYEVESKCAAVQAGMSQK